MQRIVQAVINESQPGGMVDDYFFVDTDANGNLNASWEGPMRNDFAGLPALIAGTASPAPPLLAVTIANTLNGRYRTRYPTAQISTFISTVIARGNAIGMWGTAASPLLGPSSAPPAIIPGFVPTTLATLGSAGVRRGYSLLTKYLHFCFPDAWVIYDEQATASIEMWSFFAFYNRGTTWESFTQRKTTPSSGAGYGGVTAFYRRLWAAATAGNQALLTGQAARIQNDLQAWSGSPNARVTVLDLVDKLLWKAGGDPRKLGLL